jgi:hypothetical protein
VHLFEFSTKWPLGQFKKNVERSVFGQHRGMENERGKVLVHLPLARNDQFDKPSGTPKGIRTKGASTLASQMEGGQQRNWLNLPLDILGQLHLFVKGRYPGRIDSIACGANAPTQCAPRPPRRPFAFLDALCIASTETPQGLAYSFVTPGSRPAHPTPKDKITPDRPAAQPALRTELVPARPYHQYSTNVLKSQNL